MIDNNLEKIKIKCIGDSAKEKLKEVLSGDIDLKKILKSVMTAPSCNDITPKKKTIRSTFLGVCMKGQQKGGMGKKMGECSDMFKGMNQEQKDEYKEV